jgi:hypothetical protein
MMKKKWQLRQDEGQSLVEMAITLPLLLVMFIGLIEIGYVLRNYLIVVNANREGARFAARGRWFEDDSWYQIAKRVVSAGGSDGNNEVPVLRTQGYGEYAGNTEIIITYIKIPDQVDATGGMVVEDTSYRRWFSGTLGYDSEIVPEVLAEAARQANYEFNQRFFGSGQLDIASEDNFVVVETWYEHEQLLKLPIFTEILPEIVPLYAQTTMRVTLDSRVGDGN